MTYKSRHQDWRFPLSRQSSARPRTSCMATWLSSSWRAGLLPLALHPSANFVVQAALSCIRSGDQVQRQTLQPCLLKLAALYSFTNMQSNRRPGALQWPAGEPESYGSCEFGRWPTAFPAPGEGGACGASGELR